MIQNIKTDIIYYRTSTDFEMEFNLCGCCRMRLLTDKAADKKLLIAELSRAVSRSRIIMIVGALFGEDNIVNNIAAAIGKKTVAADNKAYGINYSEEISIIEGAIPLVTEDGIYGGCIIESGPQTMILLSESKNVRKPIMNSLIHPYISEVFEAEQETRETEGEELTETTEETAEEISEEVAEAIEEIAEEATGEVVAEALEEVAEEVAETEITEDAEETEETTQEETENEETEEEEDFYSAANLGVENSEINTQNDDEIELYSEPRKIRRKETKFYNDAYGDFDIDDAGLIGDYDYDDSYRQGPSVMKIIIMVLSALILIGVGILCYAIFYVPSQEGISSSEYIRDIFNTLFG